ncbi:hypothetical protein Tco_1092789 [Tanacetum coccineum]|uniref:Uncharacterized protein n=1 Tax=Tanacetum coccineum TaxID=301880 RepID=A0ABQ5IC41_9ASTR
MSNNILDAKLVPIKDQVKIGISNFRIALEKSQPDPIYKVCLEILKQYNFFNAFIATADAPKIYMLQFCHTVSYDLTAKAHFFKIDDRIFEIKEIISFINELGCSKTIKRISTLRTNDMYQPFRKHLTMMNKYLTGKATTYDHPRLPMLQSLWGIVTSNNVDFAKLIWEDFKYQIESRKTSKQKKDMLPFSRFTKLIIKYILSQNDQISKRPYSFQHVIKLDATLGNLKFANKGTTDPIFGMVIPVLMLNDDIKASDEVNIPKRRRSKTVIEEDIVDEVNSEETEDDDEEPLVRRRPTGAVISGEIFEYEEGVDHSGEVSGVILEVPDELVHESSNEGSGVNPTVPDEPRDSSSNSSSASEDEIEDISADEEIPETDRIDVEKAKEEHVEEQEGNEQARITQADVHISEPQIKKPKTTKVTEQRPPLVDITVTLIPETTTVSPKPQPPQTKRSKTKILLKKSIKPETQVDTDALDSRVTRLEKTISVMSRFNLSEAIDKSVKAHLKNNLPKDLPDFGKIKVEKAAKKSIPKYSATPFDQAALEIYDQKDKLFKMMRECKAYNRHPAHKALYDALAVLLSVVEDDMDKQLEDPPSQKKRHRDDQDQDPPRDSEKKRKRKDADTSSFKKDGAVDDTEIEQDADMAIDDVQEDDTAPTQDWSTWFKQDDVNYIELEYNFEECYRALTDQIDWINPEGERIPYDLSKPLPLQGPPGHTTIPVDFFFNKDLEYLKNGSIERKYASSLTKPKATRYNLEGMEEMIPNLWTDSKEKYDLNASFGISHWGLKRQLFYRFGYGYLKEIVVRRETHKEYVFNEADFKRLHLNDIEDMYLLYAQNKLYHLKVHERTDLIMALQCDGLSSKEPYTIMYEPRGVVYLNKNNGKYLMRIDELHKFSDGLLKPVRDILNTRLHNFVLRYNDGMPNRSWTKTDQEITATMLEEIEKTLLKRRIMKRLECFMGGRNIETDYRLLMRT